VKKHDRLGYITVTYLCELDHFVRGGDDMLVAVYHRAWGDGVKEGINRIQIS